MSLPNTHGTLTNVEWLSGSTYYKFLQGTNRDGEIRQLTTRGPGKEKAATRIPIWVDPENARLVSREIGRWVCKDFASVFRLCCRDLKTANFSVCLLQMPREGNLVSGWEWNAPGGTGELGETPDDIAEREFSEETDLAVLCAGRLYPFQPEYLQYSSGVYDEVQQVSFALVTGNPTKLVEGARTWKMIPLSHFSRWALDQNQLNESDLWETSEFIPVDGKVVDYVNLLYLYQHAPSYLFAF